MSFPRYPKYKASDVAWLGNVPDHWTVLPAKRSFCRRKELNHGMKCENRLALTMGGVVPRDLDDLDGLQASEFETYQVFHQDDLAFKLIDLQNIKTSRVGLVPEWGIMSPAYIRLEPQKDRIVPKFAYWYFTDLYNRCVFNELGGGVRQTMAAEELLFLPFPSPGYSEQTAIASFLDRETSKIDGLVGEQRRLIELLKEKRQAVISHAVTKGLNPHAPLKPSGIEWLGDVPEHWTVMPLKHLTSIKTGFAFSSDLFTDDGVPVLRIGDITTQGTVDFANAKYLPDAFAEEHVDVMVNRNDIVMAMTGATIGKAARYTSDQPALLNQRVCIFRTANNDAQPFLWYVLQTSYYAEYLAITAFGGAQPNISDKELVAVPVPVPTAEEMPSIVTFLDAETANLDALTAEAERGIELLQERRTALISAAVTGQIDVRGLAETGEAA